MLRRLGFRLRQSFSSSCSFPEPCHSKLRGGEVCRGNVWQCLGSTNNLYVAVNKS